MCVVTLEEIINYSVHHALGKLFKQGRPASASQREAQLNLKVEHRRGYCSLNDPDSSQGMVLPSHGEQVILASKTMDTYRFKTILL